MAEKIKWKRYIFKWQFLLPIELQTYLLVSPYINAMLKWVTRHLTLLKLSLLTNPTVNDKLLIFFQSYIWSLRSYLFEYLQFKAKVSFIFVVQGKSLIYMRKLCNSKMFTELLILFQISHMCFFTFGCISLAFFQWKYFSINIFKITLF